MSIYYVAPNGDDKRTKLEAQRLKTPWRTIQHGVNQLSAGDTLYIRGGTYNERVIVPPSAGGTSSANRTAIAAYNGERVVIDGSYTLPSGGTLYFDRLIGTVVLGPSADGTYTFNAPDRPTHGSTIYQATYDRFFQIRCSYLIVDGLEIKRSRGYGIGSVDEPINDIVVRNCTIHGCRNSGFSFYNCDTLLVENCHIYDAANYAPFGRSSELFWPGVANSADAKSKNYTIRNNVIHDGWGEALYPSKTGSLLEGNIVYDSWRVGIYIERTAGSIIRNNFIYYTGGIGLYDNNGNFIGRNTDPYNLACNGIELTVEEWWTPFYGVQCENNQIYNNVIVGRKKGMALFTSNDPSQGYVRNNNVFNNTIVNCTEWNVFMSRGPGSYDNEFRNNIVYHTDAAKQAIGWPGSYAVSNNLWFGSPPSPLIGSGDVLADPKLSNPNAPVRPGAASVDNYRLLSDSPAIGAGYAVGAPAVDYDGRPRPTPPSIGAFEYVSGPVLPIVITPGFTFDSAVAALTVQFFDQSIPQSAVRRREWAFRSDSGEFAPFGNGEPDPVYTFPAPGAYEVRLTVYNSADTAFPTTQVVEVSDEPVVITPDFSFSDAGPALTVQFHDQSEPAAAVQRREWAFRSGNGEFTFFGDGDSDPAYTFGTPGAYEMRLTVYNSADAAFSATQVVEVREHIGGVCPDNLVVNGDFSSGSTGWQLLGDGNPVSFDVRDGVAALTVNYGGGTPQFMQTGLRIVGGVTYYLSFDGWVSTGTAKPDLIVRKHAAPYTVLGLSAQPALTTSRQTFTYSFTATASETNARLQLMLRYYSGVYYFDNFCLSATPPALIQADFDVSVASGPVPLSVDFFDRSSAANGVTEWEWRANDVLFSTAQNPTFVFDAPGVYTIALTVRGPDGEATSRREAAIEALARPPRLIRFGSGPATRLGIS